VVVTGAGMVTSLGLGVAANAAALAAGRSGFRPVSLFDTSRQRVGSAGEVELPGELPACLLGARQRRRVDRGTHLALRACQEALGEAGLGAGERVPLVMGTSAGAMAIGQQFYQQAVSDGGRAGQLTRAEIYQPQRQMRLLMDALGIEGPQVIISNACASGANAIGHAFEKIRSGREKRMLAGGYDALCELVFAGFDTLQALTPSGIPRPFDAARDGLALGEGAGMLVLEEAGEARARGATVLAEITGYAAATDIHHLTQPQPLGDAALETMTRACAMAGLTPDQIDYINSHGTGTPLNDVAEGNAICRWAGAAVGGVSVSSTKSAMGHLLGGAGAVETVIGLVALRGQFLPASLNVREADQVCEFDLVREPRGKRIRRVLTNSFGFGGSNATLILEEVGE
jgi:3-oxoacyl-[acyl-carrier-protein] synthase II